ncbi:two-component system sensor histidine kinase NtrB [Aurantivibrio plasticivorans]
MPISQPPTCAGRSAANTPRQMRGTRQAVWCVLAIIGFTPISPCFAQSDGLLGNDNVMLGVIIALLIIQSILIAGLQRSRLKNKQAKDKLAKSQKASEERVVERTNKLRAINNQLYEEIAKHEITEELLQETQDYLQSMVNSMPSVLIGLTREGTITQWNAAADQATGINSRDALGRSIEDVSPTINIDLQMVRNAIDQGISQTKEGIQQRDNQGQVNYTDLTIYPLLSGEVSGAVVRIDDVTMRVKFENMMIQNEKMMSLGELAAGMAHEINNPLSAILHGVQNIVRRTSADIPANTDAASHSGFTLAQLQTYFEARGINKFLDGIRDAGERSAHIVTNMLEFSRASSLKHRLVNIRELIEHSLELSDNHFYMNLASGNRKIEVIKQFSDNLPRVPCSAAEIQQVILNILRNSAQALESDPEIATKVPTITLTLDQLDDNIVISISDNGSGMNEITKRHLFEPFFTTKDVGKGTGLGLSVSYFIIAEHHDGKIEVESELSKGTTFKITLPINEADHSQFSEGHNNSAVESSDTM